MKVTKVFNQAELDEALKSERPLEIWIVGSGEYHVSGSAQVTAYGSAQVTAYDSAQVTAYDSAQVRASGSAQVTASGSAQVTAYDSAQVRASGSAQVRAYDSAQVTASKFVAVTKHAKTVTVDGGVLIEVPPIRTAEAWCEYYGIDVTNGIAILYKALDANYHSPHGADYTPGSTPAAPDWDGGERECGGGLHFSPRPIMALGFYADAKRYVGCPVALADIRAPQDGDCYPTKVKARGCAGPTFEVDIDGTRLPAPSPAGAAA